MTSVRAVLWDADGVLQAGPSDWADAFGEALGEHAERVGSTLFARLDEALAGDFDMRAHVESVLVEQGLAERRADVLAVWRRIDPLPDSRALVGEVRRTGVACYLATNQDSLRADCMRDQLDYQQLLDGSYYSCDLGVAKPNPAFWTLVADDLGLPPEQLVFVDDVLDNVVAARDVGLGAVHWHHDDGVAVLRDALAALGVAA